MAQAHGGGYYVPHHSYWPLVTSIGLFSTGLGAGGYLQGLGWGPYLLGLGLAIIIGVFFGWFGSVIREGRAGLYNDQVDISFRWGMIWFIFSEVMFFGAFFGALFYARMLSIPWLSGDDPATSKFLWDAVSLNWPTAGPGLTDLEFEPMGAWPLPTINTMLLLASGVTVTIAHHALKDRERAKLVLFMWATIALGTVFLFLQGFEYYEAWAHMNLKLSTGIYGSTFFMLTGFHGLHVLMGTIMLIVITLRCMSGHFSPEHHFGYEGVVWYWHFVDVVWLGLYIFVYII
ncbi:cytochrome c oxidase subunit 3 [Arhodomonas sp. AD133]|uniref:cytochrome c oxidase subunit 3 n=1 Tax=Arhodomonas sp. AD133 TaxID=3415009 RepID=UPI003EBC8969